MLISGLKGTSSSPKHRKNTSTSEGQFAICSPERSRQPQPMRPALYSASKKDRDVLNYQLHLKSPSNNPESHSKDPRSPQQLSSQSIEERIVSHLLLNFGILNFESTLRIRKIIEQKMKQECTETGNPSRNVCADPHAIFERSLGQFFQTMNEQEIQQLAQFHARKLLQSKPQ